MPEYKKDHKHDCHDGKDKRKTECWCKCCNCECWKKYECHKCECCKCECCKCDQPCYFVIKCKCCCKDKRKEDHDRYYD